MLCILDVLSLVLFFAQHFYFFFVQIGRLLRSTTVASLPKSTSCFWFPSSAYLLFCYRFALFFCIPLSASLFSRGLRPHPHAFCKKRGKNFCVFGSLRSAFYLCVRIFDFNFCNFSLYCLAVFAIITLSDKSLEVYIWNF